MRSFGTDYFNSCSLSMNDYLDQQKYPTMFYQLYLRQPGKDEWLEIAVKIMNFIDIDGILVNNDDNPDNDRYVQRFFVTDNVSGLTGNYIENRVGGIP